MLRRIGILLILANSSVWCHGAQQQWKLTVEVNRVVYAPGAPATARITLATPMPPDEPLVLESHLEFGLSGHLQLPTTRVTQRGLSEPLQLSFTAPADAWGYALVVRAFHKEVLRAESRDVFAVGTDHFRLGQQNNHGGTIPKQVIGLFQGDDGFWPAKWRNMKGTWLEIFAGSPSDVCGLATDWDQWITMHAKYHMSQDGIRAYTAAAHRLGLRVMMYNNATPSGAVGADWARKHPEWLSYNYQGGLRADLRVQDLERQKVWHKTLAPEQEVAAFQPFYLNFRDPALVKFGCDQMLQASRQFGYDGVRFDGHWILGDVASGLGYDMEGRRPSGDDSPDKVSTQILQQVRDYTRKRKPDFAIGFNYGNHYQRGGARNPTAYRTACGKGGMILWEGATFGKDYSDWRRGARKLRENALRVHQNGGIHYGQAHMTSITGLPCNDFSLRYYYITNFAATSHIYGGIYPGHPNYQAIQGLYYRFALRYGALLYDANLRPLQDPAAHLRVTADGVEHADLWWKPYTYKRQLQGRFQIITHLVNMPAAGVRKETSTLDKQPAPLANVRVEFLRQPERVFVLDPEQPAWAHDAGSVGALDIPRLNAWKILVQEFLGSCDSIPVERIPELDLRGRDRAPDPQEGRITFPITLFPSGDDCSSLVEDDDAQFGVALQCRAAETRSPTHNVADGPYQSMPCAAPGRLRIYFRLKVADNTRAAAVCTVQGRFGKHTIRCNQFSEPNAFQQFTYDYHLPEGVSNYVSVDYHGGTDLAIDAIVMEQLALASDRDLFAPASLASDSLPQRQGISRKIHVMRGLWHDFFGIEKALPANTTCTSSWETLSTSQAVQPAEFPATVSALLEHDLVALLNVSADSLGAVRRKNLREYVLRGGTLFVGGGPRAFGHGAYANTLLAEILPVESSRLDMRRNTGTDTWIQPASQALRAVTSFDGQPAIQFYHHAHARPGAEVLLQINRDPLLTRWKVGHGVVYAFTATPCGEMDAGTPWWEWEGWQQILQHVLGTVIPEDAPPYQPEVATDAALLGQLRGTRGLDLEGPAGSTIPPRTNAGVQVTAKGLDCGYHQPKGAAGMLSYPSGLFKPKGSIKFTVTPGWETDLTSLDQSIQLFSTNSVTHGGTFQIYVYVHSSENYALAVHAQTNDINQDQPRGHSAMYAIKRAPVGSGNSLLKTSLWKKGQPRTIEVSWSPSQLIVSENGEQMAVSNFAPEMDLSSFSGPVFLGGSASGRLARVLLKDIQIRGQVPASE